MSSIQNPFDFDLDAPDDSTAGDVILRQRISEQDRQLSLQRDEVASLRRDLAFAYRDLDEAQRSIQIARQLTMASLTETRDLCLPAITKSLLYATVEALDFAAEEGGLPEEYQRVRKRTIDQLEKLDAKGVLTQQEETECTDASRSGRVVIRYADIMRPRQSMSIDEAVELLSSPDAAGPRIVSGSNPLNVKPPSMG
jgi:hypothetical protein